MALNTEDFLWQSYFGITRTEAQKPESREKALKKCMDLAFADMARTVDYLYSSSDKRSAKKPFKDEKTDFKENKKDIIAKGIITDLFNCKDENTFTAMHEHICDEICEKDETKSSCLNSKLTYGQAQKWLNMTLKYMALMNLWNDELDNIKQFLHVPLDSYILRALFYVPKRKGSLCKKINERYKKESQPNFDLINYEDLSYANSDGKIMISEGGLARTENWNKGDEAVSWSNIKSYGDYGIIQKAVRDQIPKDQNDPEKFKLEPLEWENEVWILASQIINDKNQSEKVGEL